MTIPAPFHLLEELTDIVWQRTSPAFDAHSVQPSSSKRTKETQYERGKEKPAAKQKWKVFLQTAGLILLLTAAFVIWRHFK
jgi:hypothetical protein